MSNDSSPRSDEISSAVSVRGPQSFGKTVARFAIGAALGGAALWLTFRGADLGRVADVVSRAHAWPVLGALVLVALTVTAAAERWRLIVFRPPERGGSHRRFAAALVTAQMLNVLLPMRAGEVGRAYWISKSEGVPLGRVAVTVIVERGLDMLMLGASITIVLVQLSLPAWARTPGEMALGASVVTLAAALALAVWGRTVLRWFETRLQHLPGSMGSFIVRHGHVAVAEIAALSNWRSSLSVWALSAVLVVLAAATNYVLFFAFDLRLAPIHALLLFVVLQIGSVPVATPGNIGVFHYLVLLVLTAFGVEQTVAVAYAVVLHAVAVGSRILAGGFVLAVSRNPILHA